MKLFVSACVLLFAIAVPVNGGGPLNSFNGRAVVFPGASPVIPYRIDPGPLGVFVDTLAQRLTRESFQVWQDVPSATISFQDQGFLSGDINETNFSGLLGNFEDGINPIIFDHDGGIVEALWGVGASESILGGAYVRPDPLNSAYYKEGYVLINGRFATLEPTPNKFTPSQMKSTFVHEFGHLIGLDHTQINLQFAGNGNTADDIYLPTMYPTSTDDDTELGNLNPDDIIAVSNLYPAPGFRAGTGSLEGSIMRGNGSFVRGANVIAIRTTDPDYYKVSTVTDYYVQGTGDYRIAGLDPGEYWVSIEPIVWFGSSGSSIGPYSNTASDISFQDPVRPEYYNGPREAADPAVDSSLDRVVLSVDSGTVSFANLIANDPHYPGTTFLLKYYDLVAPEKYPMRLPSEYEALADKKYGMRFSPTVSSTLYKIRFYVYAIIGTGTVTLSIHEDDSTRSVEGTPGTQMGGSIVVPFSALNERMFHEVDVRSLGYHTAAGTDFHVALSASEEAGDTLVLVADKEYPSNRGSSWFNPGPGNQWLNLTDENNYGGKWPLNFWLEVELLESSTSSTLSATHLLPESFALGQNYPNPFNPTTVLPFALDQEGIVSLDVFDMLGRRVATLIDGEPRNAGTHSVRFDATGLRSGMYLAVLKQQGRMSSRKMVLLQ